MYRTPINRGLFETETVVLARRTPEELEVLADRSDRVLAEFAKVFQKNLEFGNALLYATGRGSSSNIRLEVVEETLRKR